MNNIQENKVILKPLITLRPKYGNANADNKKRLKLI